MKKEERKMKKGNSVSALFLSALAVFCLVCTCAPPTDGDEEDASITITIGNGSRTALSWDGTIDSTQLDHNITLTNDLGGKVEKTGVREGQSVQFVVKPGHWNISVKAYYNGTLVAQGAASVNLKRGRNPSVPITMTQVEGRTPDEPDPDAIPIEIVNIVIDVPVKDDIPPTQVDEGEGNFTVSGITWIPNDSPFQGGVAYTASVTLTANSGYTFTGLTSENAKITGNNAVITNNTGTTVTLSHTFAKTSAKTVTSITIKSSPSKMEYTHGETLNLSGLVVTLVYDDGSIDVTPENFEANGLTAIPSNGDELIFSEHNGLSVTIKHGQHLMQETTAKLTVIKANPVVSDFIFSVAETATYDGTAKSVTITPKDGKSDGTITIKYNGSTTEPINVGTYAVTFDVGVGTNYNASTTSFSAGTLTINKAPITIFTIPGVTVPSFNRSPVATITATEQYTGTVAWSTPLTNGKFAYGTVYTATITLTLKDTANYTFDGVTANSFSVAGASSVTNTASSNVVTAVFPAAPLNVSTDDDWSAAINIISSGDNNKTYTINVTDDFTTTTFFTFSPLTFTFGDVTGLTVNIEGTGSITLHSSITTTNTFLLHIGTDQTVNLKDVSLKGRSNVSYATAVVTVTEGVFNMVSGKISDNGGSGVRVNSGRFTMSGGEISGNKGSGVALNDGTFNMSGGTISGNDTNPNNSSVNGVNSGTFGGGGVAIRSNGTFNMTGGTIEKNNAGCGGGVAVLHNGTFNMSGTAKIKDNTAFGGAPYYGSSGSENSGGGVIVYAGVAGNTATFNMRGGEISGNANNGNNTFNYGYGGGVGMGLSNLGTAIFRIENGTIYGKNEADESLRNTSTYNNAFHSGDSSNSCEYGTFDDSGGWTPNDTLSSTENTIKVVDGDLK
ncbi:hypothetical protein R84B8_02669 [Treponema sp. R8-4-B8]